MHKKNGIPSISIKGNIFRKEKGLLKRTLMRRSPIYPTRGVTQIIMSSRDSKSMESTTPSPAECSRQLNSDSAHFFISTNRSTVDNRTSPDSIPELNQIYNQINGTHKNVSRAALSQKGRGRMLRTIRHADRKMQKP